MNPKLLLHPNIPKPLHGIAPRVIMGGNWWDIERKKAYSNANYCCEACGIHKQDAKLHKWLEAHEIYKYDYSAGVAKFVRLTALCHYCHNFIHNGRLEMLLREEKITMALYDDIMNHGINILKKANLLNEWFDRHDVTTLASWHTWKMLFNGKLYGPSTNSFAEWEQGKWKNWKP